MLGGKTKLNITEQFGWKEATQRPRKPSRVILGLRIKQQDRKQGLTIVEEQELQFLVSLRCQARLGILSNQVSATAIIIIPFNGCGHSDLVQLDVQGHTAASARTRFNSWLVALNRSERDLIHAGWGLGQGWQQDQKKRPKGMLFLECKLNTTKKRPLRGGHGMERKRACIQE